MLPGNKRERLGNSLPRCLIFSERVAEARHSGGGSSPSRGCLGSADDGDERRLALEHSAAEEAMHSSGRHRPSSVASGPAPQAATPAIGNSCGALVGRRARTRTHRIWAPRPPATSSSWRCIRRPPLPFGRRWRRSVWSLAKPRSLEPHALGTHLGVSCTTAIARESLDSAHLASVTLCCSRPEFRQRQRSGR